MHIIVEYFCSFLAVNCLTDNIFFIIYISRYYSRALFEKHDALQHRDFYLPRVELLG